MTTPCTDLFTICGLSFDRQVLEERQIKRLVHQAMSYKAIMINQIKGVHSITDFFRRA